MKTKIINTLALLLFLLPQIGHAKIFLEDVKHYQKGNHFITELDFDRSFDISKVKLDYINQTIQVDIPKGFLRSANSQKVSGSDKVNLIYTYQATPRTLRTRIIYNKPFLAKNLKGKVHFEKKGSSLRIKIKDTVLLPEKKAVTAKKEKPKKVITSLRTVAQKAQRAKNLKPVAVVKAQEETKSSSVYWQVFVTLLLIVVAALSGVFFLRQRKGPGDDIEAYWAKQDKDIKVLTKQSLTDEKTLVLIEYKGEEILLGMTPMNITFLKTFKEGKDKEEEEQQSPPAFMKNSSEQNEPVAAESVAPQEEVPIETQEKTDEVSAAVEENHEEPAPTEEEKEEEFVGKYNFPIR